MRGTVWNEKQAERARESPSLLICTFLSSVSVCDGRGRVGILIVVFTVIG